MIADSLQGRLDPAHQLTDTALEVFIAGPARRPVGRLHVLQPAQVANGSVDLLGEVAKSKVTGEEERYSHTDLGDFEANVDGA